MYKHLYDIFGKSWYRENGSVYIYSDPHFSDDEMKYLRKNYISDEEQIKRINSKVGKNDTIIFLGDIGNIECIKKIRGYKVLIMGNHDVGATKYIRNKKLIGYKDTTTGNLCPAKLIYNDAFPEVYEDNHLFDEVYEGPLVISEKLVLSHEPVSLPYFFNIHGHTHALPHKYDDTHINCCAEAINYTPISLKNIIESGVLKNIDSIHRQTIDEATQRKRRKITKNI